MELAQEGLKRIPKEAERVLYPINLEIVERISDQFRAGRRKIAVYRDSKKHRYVASDF